MWRILLRIWNLKDIRSRILFVLGMFVIFRAAAHIPVPGVDTGALQSFLQGNQILGLLNIFSGGSIENFSIVMLGVAPYITASIIFQLLAMVVPRLEELQKEGETGQRVISMYTRFATVPLALLQAFGLLQLLSRTQSGILSQFTTFQWLSMLLATTVGTIFLMWIGELMTEKGIGNGISLLIFASIVAFLPQAAQTLLVNYTPQDLTTYLLFLLIAAITVVGVVFITEGQRNIPVTYARQIRGTRMSGGAQSHLPLRVNTAGVIPIIFAVSVILFPPVVAQLFLGRADLLGRMAQAVTTLFANQLFYGIFYFALVFGFTYFYTAVVFRPDKMAENLQRQGAFIPGVRPGKETEGYIQRVMNRLVFSGALFLSLIAVLPVIVQGLTGSQAFTIGGTSLLIVVSVAIEMTKQIEAQLSLHEYHRLS